MKTLYLTGFCNAGLVAMGKRENSLDDDVTGDDLRVLASMLDAAELHKKQILKQSSVVINEKPCPVALLATE
jgi:hypothetical protein